LSVAAVWWLLVSRWILMIGLLSFFVLIADRLRARLILFLPSLTRRVGVVVVFFVYHFLEFGAE
jgi:hypothetical protein